MVSVCLASYNGEKFIKEQIDSILIQLQPNDELIISDDSSTDNTVKVVRSIPDPRIKLYTSNNFRDPIKNFQNALSYAKGEYIFLSDQDDIWIENKYEEMINLLKDYDLAISDSIIVDEQLNTLHPSFFSYFKSGKGIIKNVIKSSYYGSCMAFRKTILDVALPFPDTKEIGHDLWIGLVAEMIGKVIFYKKPLILYRRHSNTFTPANVGKSKRRIYQMLLGRLIMFNELVKFYIRRNYKWKKG
ncbi:glycosyltransferase family 2 protein [Mucilaginibacter sp. KACC 22063]|uniref:glycosyltransferase family 2 protein n=1 Tax=Mucilaginibacter sp. KACC 22063 TaxID=3025666 RepID=UPI00236587B5|nr:glycosyltransferase family 2 protein [Mucilaginibacter sp. KACC 22063]WDF54714.1 glycosyltransferase family 2 protein [Mucilaginibacter sp. KACC 22063]